MAGASPGLDGEQVLLACLNDKPDRLCVLGGYYNPIRLEEHLAFFNRFANCFDSLDLHASCTAISLCVNVLSTPKNGNYK
jgi:hypothetical protein